MITNLYLLFPCCEQMKLMKLYFLKSFQMALGLARIHSNRQRRNLTHGPHPSSLAIVDDQVYSGLNNKLVFGKEDLSRNSGRYQSKSSQKSNECIYFIKCRYLKFVGKLDEKLSRWNCCGCGKERYSFSNSCSIRLLENRQNKN